MGLGPEVNLCGVFMENMSKVMVSLPLDVEVYESICDMRRMRIASLKHLLLDSEKGQKKLSNLVGYAVDSDQFEETVNNQIKALKESIDQKFVDIEDIEFYLDMAVRTETV